MFLFIAHENKKSRLSRVSENTLELFERPCYMVAPLCLIMLGSTTMAENICCFSMYFAIAQHDGLGRFNNFKHIKPIRVVLVLIGAVILVIQAIRGFTLFETWIFYCFGYLIFDFAVLFHPKKIREIRRKSADIKEFTINLGSLATVQPFFCLLAILMLIFGYINF